MIMKKNLITQEGYDKLTKELKELEQTQRPHVANLLKEAIEQGDLSENDAYTQAKDMQARMEMRIRELQTILKNSQIVTKTAGDKVQVGSTIKVKNPEGKTQDFMIVSAETADPSNGKISYESPLGKAFLGNKKGDKVKVEFPAGKKEFTILDVA